jgi:PAS domain S-box-containing protein
MVSEVVGISQDLTEVTFGAIPKPLAAVIHKTFGIADFTGLAFTYGDELVGSATIVTREGQAPLSPELANVLAHVVAVSLRRKQAEEALRESERRLKIIMENSMDIIYIANRQGQITFISPQVAALGGVPEEIIGRPISEFIYPDDRARVLVDIEEMIATGVASPVEFRLATPDNRVVHLEERGHLMLQEDQVVGFFGIIRDISERKQAEAEREKLITELKAKNTELERFTYTVSHDLKSPLITINGFLGFLEKDALSGHSDRVKADVTRIKEAVEKMRGLLDDLLELSRVGRLMNPPQTVPFADLAQEAIRLVAGQLEARQIQVEIAPDLPSVCGDRMRLVEVLQNLIDNATKFMGDQPQPRLEIGVKPEPGETIFYVQDNGSGIEPRYQEEIFGLFKRLNPSTEGTGIGLALVKRIVEVHGGRVWVESEGLGRGATFCFTLAPGPC